MPHLLQLDTRAPRLLAERLAEVGFAETDAPYAAVVALRFDDVDLGSTIDQLTDAFEPDPRHGEWVRTWSQQQRVLPVVFDMGHPRHEARRGRHQHSVG